MKIKIIEERNRYDLETSVNKYLSSQDSSKILDIKYTRCSYTPYDTYYSVMIIFK